MSWKFGENDPLVNKAWSEKVVRNAEHGLIWAPLLYPGGAAAKGAIRNPGYGKGAPIIKVHQEFKTHRGNKLVIPNVGTVNAKPVMGDARAKNQKTSLQPYDLEISYDAARIPPITSEGKLNDKMTVLNFREEAKVAGASWARRTLEGLINAHLFGIKNPANKRVLDRLNLPETLDVVFKNPIVEFDSDHIMYAGGKTNDNDVAADTSAVLTAELLDQLETKVTEDMDIPLERVDLGNGEEGFLILLPGRGIEQLRADPDFREAMGQYDGPLNQLLKRKLPKYGSFVFLEYGNCLDPLANVGRAMVLGKDALHLLKVMDWEWWEGVEDTHDWINLISIAAMLGAKPTVFDDKRRNSFAVDFYKRS